jgi:transcriptional regulator with XRE-family HTH domain
MLCNYSPIMERLPHPLRRYRTDASLTLEVLARLLGVDRSTVLRWEERRIPAERVLDVERVTGIPRDKLRPDLYRSLERST